MKDYTNRILIVDDEEDLTWSISKSLSRDNNFLEIICVHSGDEAFRILEKNSIGLVISDIRMPGKNGLDLLDQIQKYYPKTKVIIMTAYSSADVKKVIHNTENVYYIEKPFDIHELKNLIFNINSNNVPLTSMCDSPRKKYESKVDLSLN